MPNSINYSKICQDLLKNLNPRTKEVVSRRFGLETEQKETLEAIGQDHNITRERTRQIEEDGFSQIRKKIDQHQEAFKYLANYLKSFGGLKKEDVLLSQLGRNKFEPHIFFLLTLNDQFYHFGETDEFYPFWTIDQKTQNSAKEIINFLTQKLAQKKEPVSLRQIYKISQERKILAPRVLSSFVEISKKIERGIDDYYGLRDWPEVNPKGLKDKAFLALKKEGKPLHFQAVARHIDELKFFQEPDRERKTLFQTVHNELIKDPRFVLVGRGIYALKEWGYEPGYVKDIIWKLLKEKGRPLDRENIIREVSKQRLVKKSTILLNLQNKKHFLRNSKGYYFIRRA
ncbi:MAG: hypothetical protein A2Z78_00900 [Candidatus Nealsonbacteria bacterium RBG_13_36_15]|uniref:HTH HARE-type domain-containing protein n=1 Tax=Candidatus Nealsonbacteria bacterium RBG_13_36_15 TaxID=1801660 RepID=A0A1G2DVU4_9BACT|nr:MAG: hypothetical protein A2Z78_00900 [Candidatus Nealsonbacteria bacterium RBG_13_36_15]